MLCGDFKRKLAQFKETEIDNVGQAPYCIGVLPQRGS